MDLWDRLRVTADRVGLAAIGATSADPFTDVRATIEERRELGLNGRLQFTSRAPETATDVRRSFAWARSIIAASMAYLPSAGSPGPVDGSGRVARFAVDEPYGRLRARLEALATELDDAGYRAVIVADDNRLVDRAAAVRAGIGWWGKNTMMLDPKHGPWLLLGAVVTDAELVSTPAMVRDCGTCSACLPACPTGALVAPGVLDARRCLAHWAQATGDIPVELRAAMADRIYGCDDCLEACPPGRQLLAAAVEQKGRVDLVALLCASDRELLEQFGHMYIPKRNADYLRRNALVALGNVGTEEHIAVLAGFLDHPNGMLRRHARWAIDEIGGPLARSVLAAADQVSGGRGERV